MAEAAFLEARARRREVPKTAANPRNLGNTWQRHVNGMLKLRKMDLTEAYTGLKRSHDKKMAASKARCGRKLLAILVTGETIAKKVSVFNSTKMVTSTKVCGL